MKEADQIKKVVQNAKTALVTSHVDPDGDSIGSMLALGLMLTAQGINVDFLSHDGVPRIYRFLTGADKVRRVPTANRIYDVLFAVDASDLTRLGDAKLLTSISKVIVNIDHHPDNTKYGKINLVGKVSSTAELVYLLAKELGYKVTLPVAEALYVAIITDTGNFRYENTSAGTFAIAHDLLNAGVDTQKLTTRIYDNRSLSSIRIQSSALQQLKLTDDGRLGWVVITEEMMEAASAKSEDLIGLVDKIRSIEGVEVAILFREDGSKVKVNFRSKSVINVSILAKSLGGGGHIKAAGTIIEGDINKVKDQVVNEATKYVKAARYLV